MKIVFINPVGVIGGAERVLLTMMAALQKADPNLQLYLIVGTDGLLVESAQKLGVQVKILELPQQVNQLGDSALKGNSSITTLLALLLRLGKIVPSIWQYLKKFRREIQEIKPDIIHSNGIKTHLLTALVGKIDAPIIWHIHDFYGARPLMAKALKLVSGGASAGIAISQAVARDAKATLPSLPIQVIYNAVDINYFSNTVGEFGKPNPPAPFPAREGGEGGAFKPLSLQGRGWGGVSPHTPIKVGLVATFARWKGHDIFLEAAAQILRDRPDLNVRFYIIGAPIYQTKGSQFSEPELKEKASLLQIEDKVEFLGFQQNIAETYRWLDIVVHASTQPEPFGLAIVEAMACGKPVIVSQAGGAAEIFTHDYDAVGFPPGDSIALASAIEHLIENPDRRQSISENARLTVIKNFSSDRLGEQILATYRKHNKARL